MGFEDRLVSAERAFQISSAARHAARWPRRGEGSRLEPIADPFVNPRFKFNLGDVVFTIGSCFARNIEEYLGRLGMVVPTLDFSVPPTEVEGRPASILNKYTVPSITQELERAARAVRASTKEERARIIAEPLIDTDDGMVIDMDLVGLRPVTRERGLERRRDVHELFSKAFTAQVVTITFGLVEAWYDRERQVFIQETPRPPMVKRYPGRFAWVSLNFEECLSWAVRAIDAINSIGPEKKIIITTSPVPLFRTFEDRDVLLANSYAKSCLRAVCDHLFHMYSNVDYFPSYEMVILSKDPSVWHDDLGHVQDDFVARIVGKLVDNYVEGGTA